MDIKLFENIINEDNDNKMFNELKFSINKLNFHDIVNIDDIFGYLKTNHVLTYRLVLYHYYKFMIGDNLRKKYKFKDLIMSCHHYLDMDNNLKSFIKRDFIYNENLHEELENRLYYFVKFYGIHLFYLFNIKIISIEEFRSMILDDKIKYFEDVCDDFSFEYDLMIYECDKYLKVLNDIKNLI